MFPEMLSLLQQEFKFWHDKFSQLHPKFMFRLEKIWFLPSIFIDLKEDVPICESLMFVKAKKRKYRTKGNNSGFIRKETDNKPWSGVSVDQVQSYQPWLFQQFSGKLTGAHIWSAQVVVDHFSDLTYIHLMRSTIQRYYYIYLDREI